MKSRLGHYTAATPGGEPAEIAISRAHLRRHGWEEALHTLLHEMVHQWQDETGHTIDHGRDLPRQGARGGDRAVRAPRARHAAGTGGRLADARSPRRPGRLITFRGQRTLHPRDMLDFFDIDSALTEEERAVRDSVRRFVDERVLPIIGDAYVQGRFPSELIPEMGSSACSAPTSPRSTAARGSTTCSTGSSCRSSSAAIRACARSRSVQGALAMYPIYAFGSEEQKRRWLPPMARVR